MATLLTHSRDYTVTPEGQELAADILAYFRQHPDRHNQSDWFNIVDFTPAEQTDPFCGTTCCVSGAAVLLTKDERFEFRPVGELVQIVRRDYGYPAVARELLGLNYFDAYILFYMTAEWQAIKALKYLERGERPDWAEIFSKDRLNDIKANWDLYEAAEAEYEFQF